MGSGETTRLEIDSVSSKKQHENGRKGFDSELFVFRDRVITERAKRAAATLLISCSDRAYTAEARDEWLDEQRMQLTITYCTR